MPDYGQWEDSQYGFKTRSVTAASGRQYTQREDNAYYLRPGQQGAAKEGWYMLGKGGVIQGEAPSAMTGKPQVQPRTTEQVQEVERSLSMASAYAVTPEAKAEVQRQLEALGKEKVQAEKAETAEQLQRQERIQREFHEARTKLAGKVREVSLPPPPGWESYYPSGVANIGWDAELGIGPAIGKAERDALQKAGLDPNRYHLVPSDEIKREALKKSPVVQRAADIGAAGAGGAVGTVGSAEVFARRAVGSKAEAPGPFEKAGLYYQRQIAEETPITQVAGGLGSMVPTLGTGMAVRGLTKLPGLARAMGGIKNVDRFGRYLGAGVAGASEAASEAGSVYRQAVDEGFTPEQASKRMWGTFAANIPLNILMDKIAFFDDKAGSWLRQYAKTATPEAVQEAAQQAISNIALDRPWHEGTVAAGALGAVTAGIVGTPGIIRGKRAEARASRETEELRQGYHDYLSKKIEEGRKQGYDAVGAAIETAKARVLEQEEVQRQALREDIATRGEAARLAGEEAIEPLISEARERRDVDERQDAEMAQASAYLHPYNQAIQSEAKAAEAKVEEPIAPSKEEAAPAFDEEGIRSQIKTVEQDIKTMEFMAKRNASKGDPKTLQQRADAILAATPQYQKAVQQRNDLHRQIMTQRYGEVPSAAQEIKQPEGVQGKPEEGVGVRPTEEAGPGDRVQYPEAGQEERPVVVSTREGGKVEITDPDVARHAEFVDRTYRGVQQNITDRMDLSAEEKANLHRMAAENHATQKSFAQKSQRNEIPNMQELEAELIESISRTTGRDAAGYTDEDLTVMSVTDPISAAVIMGSKLYKGSKARSLAKKTGLSPAEAEAAIIEARTTPTGSTKAVNGLIKATASFDMVMKHLGLVENGFKKIAHVLQLKNDFTMRSMKEAQDVRLKHRNLDDVQASRVSAMLMDGTLASKGKGRIFTDDEMRNVYKLSTEEIELAKDLVSMEPGVYPDGSPMLFDDGTPQPRGIYQRKRLEILQGINQEETSRLEILDASGKKVHETMNELKAERESIKRSLDEAYKAKNAQGIAKHNAALNKANEGIDKVESELKKTNEVMDEVKKAYNQIRGIYQNKAYVPLWRDPSYTYVSTIERDETPGEIYERVRTTDEKSTTPKKIKAIHFMPERKGAIDKLRSAFRLPSLYEVELGIIKNIYGPSAREIESNPRSMERGRIRGNPNEVLAEFSEKLKDLVTQRSEEGIIDSAAMDTIREHAKEVAMATNRAASGAFAGFASARQGIPGASLNLWKTLGTYSRAVGMENAERFYGGQVEQELERINNERKDLRPYVDWVKKKIEKAKTPVEGLERFASSVKGFNYFWDLGGKLTMAAQNKLQKYQTENRALDVLYGENSRAAKNAAGRIVGLTNFTEKGLRDESGALTPVAKQAVDGMFGAGEKSNQILADLSNGISRANAEGTFFDQVSREAWEELMSGIGEKRGKLGRGVEIAKEVATITSAPFEQQNRMRAYVAAYLAERAKGAEHMDAHTEAQSFVNLVHFARGRAQYSDIQQSLGGVGNLALQYKQFMFDYYSMMNMLYKVNRSKGQGRVKASLPLFQSVAPLVAVSGLRGLPAFFIFRALWDLLAEAFGFHNANAVKKSMAKTWLGNKGVEAIFEGPTNMVGFSMPWASQDMVYLDPSASVQEQMAALLLGPTGAKLKQGEMAFGRLKRGEVGRAALEIAPTVVRVAGKEILSGAEGKRKAGMIEIPKSKLQAAIGATGLAVATEQRQAYEVSEEIRKLRQEKKDLLKSLADERDVETIRKRVKTFQKKVDRSPAGDAEPGLKKFTGTQFQQAFKKEGGYVSPEDRRRSALFMRNK